MHVEPQSGAHEVSVLAESRALQSFAAVAALIALVVVVYWPTTASMVDTWIRSETFTHGFVVMPAALWFVWTSRTRLAAISAKPWWPALIALAGAGLAWLASELASAQAPAQWAMVLMVPCAVLALFGWGWVRVLAFPLTFLFFAVPFGEAFVPTLIDWTADFTVAAVSASGIPVFREGANFVIPSGRWSVVEACSGIRYLIASLVVGVLYAWVMYRSPLRRTLFIAASVLVPLVANWLRAYLIVMIGHLTDNRLAAGVDHLIYGWVFFGMVVGAMFWIGAHWREDHDPLPMGMVPFAASAAASSALRARLLPSVPLLIVAALMIGAWPVARDSLLVAGDKRPIQPATVAADGGWIQAQNAVANWRPVLEGPVHTQVQSFSRAGATVTVFIGYYRDQKQGSELVNSMNRLVPERGTPWEQIGRGGASASFDGVPLKVHAATLRSVDQRLRVWHWYWIDGHVSTSDAGAKSSLALDRLLGRTDTSAWVAVFTAADTDAAADQTLAAFTRDMGAAIQSALAATAER